jgi:pyruvate dehydrogenase E2 component (dihydrolipoamide acetyltransferase)
MAISVVMPALEMAQETGKLLSWRKKEGESVKKGEPLLEIETDKAVVEIEAAADGVLAGVKAHEGAVVPVGQTIAWLVQPGETPPADTGPAQTGRRTDSAPAAQAVVAPAAASSGGSARISPKARRLAKEHGVDIGTVSGTGPGGEILASDIMARAQSGGAAAARSTTAAAPPSSDVPETLSAIGRLMAERTTQSWTSVPHFFVTREIDARALVALRDKLVPVIEKSHGVKPTHTDLLVALVARALRQHPRMNASWGGNGIRVNPDVNVAIAMAVNDGVVTAVIPKADTASVADIAVRRRELTERARNNRLQPSDIAGATFTISNLGMYHVDAFTAIIVPPQAGILAVGAIANRVVAIDGDSTVGIGVRPTMSVTLSCDHRVLDGARGAAFLNDVVEAIRDPEKHVKHVT